MSESSNLRIDELTKLRVSDQFPPCPPRGATGAGSSELRKFENSSIRKFLASLLALLFLLTEGAGQQNGNGAKQQPIKDWTYQKKETNPRTGQEEVTVILKGVEALPINVTKGKEVFEVRGITARYFTDPKPGEKSEEIQIEADHARMDNGARTLKLNDQVRVRKQDGSVLTTSSAVLHFNPMFVCPKCEVTASAAGRCPVHAVDLKEKTTTRVETDKEFELTKPEGLLKGEGLSADDAIRQYQVTRKGFMEFAGDPAALDPKKKRTDPLQAMFTQLLSQGPLLVNEDSSGVAIVARSGVRLDRIDPQGMFTVESDQAVIEVIKIIDPDSARRTLVPRGVDAQGNVRLTGVTYADSMGIEARADRLVWEQETGADYVLDIARLSSEKKVLIRSAAGEIAARRVTLDRVGGVAYFEEEVDSKMIVGKEKVDLSCGTMTTRTGPLSDGSVGLISIEAQDKVVLGGLLSKPKAAAPADAAPEPPGRAEADRFTWDLIEERGVLEGRPFVKILQGPNTILAPKIALESPEIFVLKGPKRIKISQVRDGKAEEYTVTSEGDIVVNSATGSIRMRDTCELRTQSDLPGQAIRLFSNRVDVGMGKDGKSVESLFAIGNVRAIRAGTGATVYGDRLQFNPADQSMEIVGYPHTVADTGRTVITQKKIKLYEKDKIRYTESEGARIIIDEKVPAANGPK